MWLIADVGLVSFMPEANVLQATNVTNVTNVTKKSDFRS